MTSPGALDPSPPSPFDAALDRLIGAFVGAPTLADGLQVVRDNQLLFLSAAVDDRIDVLLRAYDGDERTTATLHALSELLRDCRSFGTDIAFARVVQPPPAKAALVLRTILQFLDRPARLGDMPDRITLCQTALRLIPDGEQGTLRAALHNILGKSLAQNPHGERAANQEQAIACYTAALQFYAEAGTLEGWAATLGNLGVVYSERVHGERAQNQEQAIACFQAALHVYTEDQFPEQWAMTQNNLAAAYGRRIHGDRMENDEQAIAHYQAALRVYTESAYPERWAMTQNNLASAYRVRLNGERAANEEQAITHYEAALRVLTELERPEQWATTQSNLGNLYLLRVRGDRAENQEQAIAYYQAALRVRTEAVLPEAWATTQHNLGLVYGERIYGERAANEARAIAHYQAALRVHTERAFPERWAMIQHNLGTLVQGRVEGERAQNQEQAIACFGAALRVRTEAALPEDWAATQHNLGNVYRDRIEGEHAQNQAQAKACYQAALRVYTPTRNPHRAAEVAYTLGAVLYAEGRWDESRRALETAHEAVERLRGFHSRDQARRDLSGEHARLYALLVACCLRQEDTAAAFRFAVAGKGRAFIDLLNTTRFERSADTTKRYALAIELADARALRERIDAILVRLERATGASYDSLLEQVERLQYEETALWEELAFRYPALTATQQAPQLVLADAHALSQTLHATLVEYVEHALGWTAFVVTGDALHAVALPGLTDDLATRFEGWYAAIASPATLDARSDEPLIDLHDAALAPLRPFVPPNTSLVLAPAGWLHRVPFAAALNRTTGTYASHEYRLSFAPSLGALHVALAQARRHAAIASRPSRAALTVAYPGIPGTPRYLRNVVAEAEVVSARFRDVTTLHDEQARPEVVIEHAPHKTIIHFGCHGAFDARNPRQSGLALAGGWLIVQRIVAELRLTGAELVTLGACVTGLSHAEGGEEHVGLVQAMLSAGARAVVGSLWSVDDESTRELFKVFYAAIAAQVQPDAALRAAQRMVASRPGWEHPVFWAAFQVYGLVVPPQP
jgi:tetratricopeptide (TPR) repeat protein